MNGALIISEAGINYKVGVRKVKKRVDVISVLRISYVKFITFLTEVLIQRKAKNIKE